MTNAFLDQNSRPTLTALSSANDGTIVNVWADPVTHRLLVDSASGSGTVTSVSVVTANGFAGSVANATTTPAITLTTTITGVLKGNGTAISAASAGTDYVAPGAITTSGLTMATARLLGRTTASTGAVEEITVGSGLTLSAGSLTANAASLTVGTTTIASGTTTRVLYDNAGVLGEYTISGTGNVAMTTSPSFTTPTLGVASATSINKVAITAPATSATLTIADGKTFTCNDNVTVGTGGLILGNSGGLTCASSKVLTVNNSITLSGTDSTTMTFPSTTATIARTDAAQTFTGTQTFSQTILTANAITATSNAATIPVTSGRNIVTNNSAATLTITLTTTSAVNMQTCIVQILDASAVAQTLSWVNTEDSSVTAPTTTNGSTTLPLTVGFIYNSATSKWRCIAKA